MFGDHEGFLCIAHAPATKHKFKETFFHWPDQAPDVISHVNSVQTGNNVWFGAQLLETPQRRKEHVGTCYALWADLDECSPEDITPKPSIVLKSSADRWQAFWTLTEGVGPLVAEDYSHRIAHAYKDKGVDPSGWDLTQLLRVPFTFNYKYPGRPIVELDLDGGVKYKPKQFADEFEAVPNFSVDWVEPPQRILNADTVLDKYMPRIDDYVMTMYHDEPDAGSDWSAVLWKFMQCLFDAGMDKDEVYAVANTAACNKFQRDGKPERLWHDVLRAAKSRESSHTVRESTPLPDFPIPFLTTESFIEKYADWAESLIDAPRQYHEVGAFIMLSCMCSTGLEIETSVGNIKTNLWAIILGETTLTRKTTSMRLAVKMMQEVDDEILLATEEGSIEGIMEGMRTRPHRASLFYRDEIAGMFKSVIRKDYLSGMLESFTKLYDGDTFRRLLRKEVIHVREPVFVFFGGGIKNATLSALGEEHLTSGFLPRFLWVVGETDPAKIRPIGKRTDKSRAGEDRLIAQLKLLYYRYSREQELEVMGQKVAQPIRVIAEVSDAGWDLWNEFEQTYVGWASKQPSRDALMPVVSRMATNCLKMAALIAALRQEPDVDETIKVEAGDIHHAIHYVKKWLPHTLEVIRDVGVGHNEALLQKVLESIRRHPGVSKSTLMRNHRLMAQEMKGIQDTLRERMLIRVEKRGKAELHYATD